MQERRKQVWGRSLDMPNALRLHSTIQVLLGILNANRKIRKRTNTDVAFTREYSRVSIFHRERECTNEDPRSPKDNYIIIFGGKRGSFLRVL